MIKDSGYFVSIIVINYNGKEYLEGCIESIFNTIGCKFEVILIDNASTDSSSLDCSKKFPQIRFFQNKENQAMSARNIGIDNAKGDFILFLDADTVVKPDSISKLIDSYTSHGDGLYQGKMLAKLDPTKIESCGNMTNIFGFGFARGRGRSDKQQHEGFEKISFPVGGYTFSSRSIIKKIGYIDESHLFFLMLDDLDYGWRALQLGIPCFYEPQSIIYHLGSPILQWKKKKFYYAERNRWICILCNYSTKSLFKLFPLLILIDIGTLLFLSTKGMAFMKIKSSFSVMRILSKILERRKLIQQKRLVNDNEIIKNFVDYVELPSMMEDENSSFNSILVKLSRIGRKLIG